MRKRGIFGRTTLRSRLYGERLESRHLFTASYLDAIGWTQLSAQLGAAMPNGSGITASQIEHVEQNATAGYAIDVNNSDFSGKSITIESGPSAVSQHATRVGQHFFGLSAGVSPGVSNINNWELNDWSSRILESGTTLPPNVDPQQIENHSWDGGSNGSGNGASDLDVLRRFDYVINRDNLIAVVAVGNSGATTVPHLLASNYNGITVGMSDGTANHGLTTFDGSMRTKPDIVAPESTSSLATPQVSGAAALLLDEASRTSWSAAAKADAARSQTIKAVLMAGATKDQLASWSRTTDHPIDQTYGAGQLNVYNSYFTMAAGEQAPGTIGLQGWDLAQSTTASAGLVYTFTVPAGTAVDQMSVSLNWNRSVTNGSTTGFGNLQSSLAHFALKINQVSGSTITPVDSSTSVVDNLQYLYLKNLSAGTYQLVVTADQSQVPFALAWSSSTSNVGFPGIALVGDGHTIANNESTPQAADATDFGLVGLNAGTLVHTYTIQNTGTATLNLTGSPLVQSNSAQFTIVAQPPVSSLAPGASTTFQVGFTPGAAVSSTGTITIGNSDAQHNPFTFTVHGTGTTAAGQAITDDGDLDFATVGTWTQATDSNPYGGDYLYHAAGTGANTATWTFPNLSPGQYEVSVRWVPNPNRATNAPFTVYDGSNSLGTVAVNQQLSPAGTTWQGFDWLDLGAFTITGNTLKVVLTDNANSYVIADAVLITAVTQPIVPALAVSGNGQSIAAGSQTPTTGNGTDFGTVAINTSVTHTFTIQNTGSTPLNLTGNPAVLSNSATFTVVSQPSATVLGPGASTTFQVRFLPTAAGLIGASIWLPTNDPQLNAFSFGVQGTGATVVTPSQVALDDGDPDFATVGTWTRATDSMPYNGDYLYHAAGTGANTATWTFPNLSPGQYQVAAHWVPNPNRATNAPYTIYDGSTALSTVPVNQQANPAGVQYQGLGWLNLGTFNIQNGTLKVVLSDKANGYVIADGILLTSPSAPIVPKLALSGSGQSIPAGESAPSTTNGTDFGSVVANSGTMVNTFTIQNNGSTTLHLSGTPLVTLGGAQAADFSIVTQPAASVAPGASTTFQVQFKPTATGLRSATISIASDDTSANPFTFAVQGTGATQPAEIFGDDGNTGFSTVGTWTVYTTDPTAYLGDYRYHAKGTGANKATWQFPSLAAGTYQVSAHWVPNPNRATNAPFQVFDGSVSRGTVLVNEQLAPNGVSSQGIQWTVLGQFNVQSGTLKVVLSDKANGYVIADGIRIVPVVAGASASIQPAAATALADTSTSTFAPLSLSAVQSTTPASQASQAAAPTGSTGLQIAPGVASNLFRSLASSKTSPIKLE